MRGRRWYTGRSVDMLAVKRKVTSSSLGTAFLVSEVEAFRQRFALGLGLRLLFRVRASDDAVR